MPLTEPYSWIYTVQASYTCAWSHDRGSRMSLMDFCLGAGTGFPSKLVLASVGPLSSELLFLVGRSLRGAATGFWRWCVGGDSLRSEDGAPETPTWASLSLDWPMLPCVFTLKGGWSIGGRGARLFFLFPSGAGLPAGDKTFFWMTISWLPSNTEAHGGVVDSSSRPMRNCPLVSPIFFLYYVRHAFEFHRWINAHIVIHWSRLLCQEQRWFPWWHNLNSHKFFTTMLPVAEIKAVLPESVHPFLKVS